MKAASSRWARPRTSTCARVRASWPASWAPSTGSLAPAFAPNRAACLPPAMLRPAKTRPVTPRPIAASAESSPALSSWAIVCRCWCASLATWMPWRNCRAAPPSFNPATPFSSPGAPPMRSPSHEAAHLLPPARVALHGRAVRSTFRHRAGLQLSDPRRLRWHRAALDRRELSAPLRSPLSRHSVALLRHGPGRYRLVPPRGISRGALHLARRPPQESLPATRHAALLDQFPGAHLRLDFPAARHRPVQYRIAGAGHHPWSTAAAL